MDPEEGGRRRKAGPRVQKRLYMAGQEDGPTEERQVDTTVLVPYTVGSRLRTKVQNADDALTALLGSRKVRLVESGGDKLVHLLSRNDPWAAKRVCKDSSCVPCASRTWLREKEKECKKMKEKMPELLITKTSTQCRREGCNYILQCLLCLPLGKRSLYRGESGKSAQEHQAQHAQGIAQGIMTNPLVLHSIKENGGVCPQMIATIDRIESRPLYRAVREAVKISQLHLDNRNMNSCQEWGPAEGPVLGPFWLPL